MAEIRNYTIPAAFDVSLFCDNIAQYMIETLKLEAQTLSQGNAAIVQGRESNTVKRYIGMDKAVTAKITHCGDLLTVEVGQGKWMDKAAGAAVAWFVFWPAIVPAMIGAFQQMQLPSKILAYVNEYVIIHRSASAQQSVRRCRHCSAGMGLADLFCRSCGKKTEYV